MTEQIVRELVGGEIKAEEVEKLNRRLEATREALARLEPLLDSNLEPLPTVTMEEE